MTTRSFPEPLDPAEVQRRRSEFLEIAETQSSSGWYSASWADLRGYSVPDWFRDAKFGIFIHWLAASVPAYSNEWYPRTMYREEMKEFTHHRETYGDQRDFGFKEFIPRFTASPFDADDWMALIAATGAKYVIPVAEHHDGFHLGHTELSRWSATRVGPHRDVLAELREAASQHGVRFGLSSHRAENWWFYNGGIRFLSDVQDPQWRDLYGPARPESTQPDEAFLDDWLARTVELVERYDPELLWFDWWIEQPAFEPYRRRFAAYFYNRAARQGREVVINYKWDAFEKGTAVYDIERGVALGISDLPFQNDTSTSRVAWAHLSENEFKNVDEILGDLVDAVSKNGSLLLNIGPRPDGTIDHRERALLQDIGAWMDVNSEAIHGTRPWVVSGEGPTAQTVGSFVDTAATPWTAQDLRFTTSGDTLYVIVLNLPQEGGDLTVRSLSSSLRIFEGEVTHAQLLGSPIALEVSRDREGLHVTVPPRTTVSSLAVLKVDLQPATPPARSDPPLFD